jgi:hypothetical protein
MAMSMINLKPKYLIFLNLVALLGLTGIVSTHALVPPTATVALQPIEAYADTILRGSATFSDPDGDLEGSSTYRWLVNGSQVATGDVPQSMLLPLDGSLLSTDSQTPAQSQGLAFFAGRFGQAMQISETAIGDLVTFELTSCDETGACGAPASASVTVSAPPLGALQPALGLLPSGTISVTLSLTTTFSRAKVPRPTAPS